MRVVTFGEVMLRLAPEGNYRLRQVLPGKLDATFGGGELNVAVSVAIQGGRSAFLTAAIWDDCHATTQPIATLRR